MQLRVGSQLLPAATAAAAAAVVLAPRSGSCATVPSSCTLQFALQQALRTRAGGRWASVSTGTDAWGLLHCFPAARVLE